MQYNQLPSVAGTDDILPGPSSLSAYPSFFFKCSKNGTTSTYKSPSGSTPLLRLIQGIYSNLPCPEVLAEPTIAAWFGLRPRRGYPRRVPVEPRACLGGITNGTIKPEGGNWVVPDGPDGSASESSQ